MKMKTARIVLAINFIKIIDSDVGIEVVLDGDGFEDVEEFAYLGTHATMAFTAK